MVLIPSCQPQRAWEPPEVPNAWKSWHSLLLCKRSPWEQRFDLLLLPSTGGKYEQKHSYLYYRKKEEDLNQAVYLRIGHREGEGIPSLCSRA